MHPHIPLVLLDLLLLTHLILELLHAALYILVVALRVQHLLKHGQLVLYPDRERLIRVLHVVKRLLQVLTPVLVHYDAVLDLPEPPGQLLEHADLGVRELQLVLDLTHCLLQVSHVGHHGVVGLLDQVDCREKRDHQVVDDASDAVLEAEPVQFVLGAPRGTVRSRLLVQVAQDTGRHKSVRHVVVQVPWCLGFI